MSTRKNAGSSKLKFLAAIFFIAAILSACVSIRHSAKLVNGRYTAKTCYNGDCHTLIGFGNIRVQNNVVVVHCEGSYPFTYEPSEMKGYDCENDEPIWRD